MQIRSYLADKDVPEGFGAIRLLGLIGDHPHLRIDLVQVLLLAEQVRHLTRVDQIVDVLQERLVGDLQIREDEAHSFLLVGGQLDQLLEVTTEALSVVVAGHLDLEHLRVHDEAGQLAEGLFAAATHANQHGVASWLPQYAANLDDLLHCHIKEHQR